MYFSWFRGGLVFKTHRLLYHSTLGLRVIKKKKYFSCVVLWGLGFRVQCSGFGFRAWGLAFRVQYSVFRVWGLGFRV